MNQIRNSFRRKSKTESYEEAEIKYEPLPSKRSIRLVKLPSRFSNGSYSFATCSVDDSKPYGALSYTWGAPLDTPESHAEYHEKATVPIKFETNSGNGTLWHPVKKNLAEGLDALKDAGVKGYLWIDALCINQEDPEELKNQIPLMGEIFSKCKKVYVWLGKSEDDLENFSLLHEDPITSRLVALTAKRKFNRTLTLESLSAELQVDINMDVWRSYNSFLEKRRWFSRAWVIQEVAVAPAVQVLCGRKSIDWRYLFFIANFISTSISRLDLFGLRSPAMRDQPVGMEIVRLFEAGRFYQSTRFADGYVAPTGTRLHKLAALEWMLSTARFQDASRPHDKIYSVMGLFAKLQGEQIDPLLEPDYDLPVEEVYTRASWLLIRDRHYMLLLQLVEDSSLGRMPGLPSWVPDFSCRAPTNSLVRLPRPKPLNASRVEKDVRPQCHLKGRGLFVNGVHFNTIAELDSERKYTLDNHDQCREIVRHMESLLRLCLKVKTEDLIGALWKTMTADGVSGAYEKPKSEEHYILYLSWSLGYCKVIDPNFGPLSSCLDMIEQLNKNANMRLPSRELITQVSQLDRRSEHSQTISKAVKEFLDSYSPVMLNRRLYLTAEGNLGVGPKSLHEGDQVWMLEGASSLFVLRGTDIKGEYKLVGETYLHGFMRGEILDTDAKDRIGPLTLV